MKEKLFKSLICGVLVIGLAGCGTKKQKEINIDNDAIKKEYDDSQKIVKKQEDVDFFPCLENELGGYITSEKNNPQELSLDDITARQNQITYFKGLADGDNIYVIYQAKVYESDFTKDFDMFFSKKFDVFQKYIFSDGTTILIHNPFNDVDFNKLSKKCNISNLEKTNIKNIPDETIKKLEKTNKVIVKSGNNEQGVITDKDTISDLLKVIKTSEQFEYKGTDTAYLCDGYGFNFEMYIGAKLIDTIYMWNDGKRILPESEDKGGCFYYSVTDTSIDLRKIIEQYTIYEFYGLYDYAGVCGQALEKIYEDEKYEYYLNCIKSDEVLIHFNITNLMMTLKYALNNNYITPDSLAHDNLIIRKEK